MNKLEQTRMEKHAKLREQIDLENRKYEISNFFSENPNKIVTIYHRPKVDKILKKRKITAQMRTIKRRQYEA